MLVEDCLQYSPNSATLCHSGDIFAALHLAYSWPLLKICHLSVPVLLVSPQAGACMWYTNYTFTDGIVTLPEEMRTYQVYC